MKSTIDKAGRIVLPAEIRRRTGLRPGEPLEIDIQDGDIRIRRDVPGMRVVRERGRLVARPTVPAKDLPPIDIARLVEEERDRWP